MVKYYMRRCGWKRPDGAAGVILAEKRKTKLETRVLVCWVLIHIWRQDHLGHSVLGLVQNPAVVEGLTAVVLLQLIMGDNFGLSSSECGRLNHPTVPL